MDMYVYKLPNCCAECEHCTKAHEGKFGIPFCNVARMPIYNGQDIKGRGHHTDSFSDFDCPLKLIQDHDKDKDQEHELLITQFREETEKLRKQIKFESDARKRFVQAVKEKDQRIAELEKALELMSLVLCTGAREDLKREISKFNWRQQVVDYFKAKAKEELDNGQI